MAEPKASAAKEPARDARPREDAPPAPDLARVAPPPVPGLAVATAAADAPAARTGEPRADAPAPGASAPPEDAGRPSLVTAMADIEPLQVDVEGAANDGPKESVRPSSAPPPMLPAPIARVGRYDILGRLAFGGMAEIYLARETAAGDASRLLVVKFVRDVMDAEGDFSQMFLNEGRLAMRLNHPNICHVYEFGQDQGRLFIAMEWIEGVTLNRAIRRARERKSPIPVPIAVRVVADIAEALGYAHRARDERGERLGIVHRDVSPHNIMLSYDGVVKLLDFGVAKARTSPSMTQSGRLKGKLGYIAPEQIRGKKLDGRADVFALGITLFELLTGRRLFRRETEFDTLKAILEDPVPLARTLKAELPPELDEILQKALEKEPNARYQRAEELQEALEQFLADQREPVSRARIARMMRELYAEEIRKGPVLDQETELTSHLRVAVRDESGSQQNLVLPTTRRRWKVTLLAAGAAALAGIGLWAALREPTPPEPHVGTPDSRVETPARLAPSAPPPPAVSPPAAPVAAAAEPQRPTTAPAATPAPATEAAERARPATRSVRPGSEPRRRNATARTKRAGAFASDPGF